jgi:hypothetical protein
MGVYLSRLIKKRMLPYSIGKKTYRVIFGEISLYPPPRGGEVVASLLAAGEGANVRKRYINARASF